MRVVTTLKRRARRDDAVPIDAHELRQAVARRSAALGAPLLARAVARTPGYFTRTPLNEGHLLRSDVKSRKSRLLAD